MYKFLIKQFMFEYRGKLFFLYQNKYWEYNSTDIIIDDLSIMNISPVVSVATFLHFFP